MAIKLKCPRCGHEWSYRGKNPWYATCPFCLIKVSIKKYRQNGARDRAKIKRG
jgi:hypothetical protein